MSDTDPSMTARKDIAVRAFDEVFSRAEFDHVEDLFTDDFLAHAFPDLREPDGVKDIVSGFHEGFPDIEWTVEQLVGEGAFVTVRWTATGTHEGEFRGRSATGTYVEFPGITLLRFENDQIAEGWTVFNALSVLEQIDVGGSPDA